MKNVFVLGSVNTDLVMSVDRLPVPGESRRGYGFMRNQGGKGANQAVACKKLGCERVVLLGAVGKDGYGRENLEALRSYGIDVSAVEEVEHVHSGVCLILLDESRNDNILVVDPGANEAVDPKRVAQWLRDHAEEGDIFVAQLEMNLTAVSDGLAAAKERGAYTILNPAPAVTVGKEILGKVDLVVLNETEARFFAGVEVQDARTAEKVYRYFHAFGVGEVIVTLGAKGSYYMNGETVFCAAFRVEAVDSTCAGDAFIGALAFRKAEGEQIAGALGFASRCSAVTVSRKGAASSVPTAREMANFGYDPSESADE